MTMKPRLLVTDDEVMLAKLVSALTRSCPREFAPPYGSVSIVVIENQRAVKDPLWEGNDGLEVGQLCRKASLHIVLLLRSQKIADEFQGLGWPEGLSRSKLACFYRYEGLWRRSIAWTCLLVGKPPWLHGRRWPLQ